MRPLHLSALGALALLPAACGSAPTRFYTLDPVAPQRAPATFLSRGLVRPVRVVVVRLPAEWNRPELVEESGAYSVTVHDLARWSAPVGQMARRVLTQDLMARLPAGSVVFPDATAREGGLALEVSVLSVSDVGRRVVVDVSWKASIGEATAAAHALRLDVEEPVSTEKAPAELSAALAQLADDIAANLVTISRAGGGDIQRTPPFRD